MSRTDYIGKKFRCLKTFSREDNIFKEGDHYELLDIDPSSLLNIFYLSDSEGKKYIYPEFNIVEKFEDFFISIDDERRININKILYED